MVLLFSSTSNKTAAILASTLIGSVDELLSRSLQRNHAPQLPPFSCQVAVIGAVMS